MEGLETITLDYCVLTAYYLLPGTNVPVVCTVEYLSCSQQVMRWKYIYTCLSYGSHIRTIHVVELCSM